MNDRTEGYLQTQLEQVISDLQNEHTRFQNRLAAAKQQGPDNGYNYEEKHNLHISNLESKVEYLELLIRRYRNWLRE